MLYRVLALDPGGTTGWATYTAEKMWIGDLPAEEKVEYYDEKWACGQIEHQDHHNALDQFLGFMQTEAFVIVCESFEFRNTDRRHRDNISLISREYIGVVMRFCQERHLKPVMQTATLAKGFIPDKGPQANKKIREAGLWYPNSPHAMDATRHLLWYLVNRDNRTDLVERWWKPKH
jgi:hypothetical protein